MMGKCEKGREMGRQYSAGGGAKIKHNRRRCCPGVKRRLMKTCNRKNQLGRERADWSRRIEEQFGGMQHLR